MNAHRIAPPRKGPPSGRLRRLFERAAGRFTPRVVPRVSPLRSPIEPLDLELERALVDQARALRPDVILNQSVSEVESVALHKMRPHARLIVGQIASPLPEQETYRA